MNSFYVTLPSNTIHTETYTNYTTDYKVQLAQAINLTGQWEVALVEIQYINSLYNVQEDVHVTIAPVDPDTPLDRIDFVVPAGYYEHPEDIFNHLPIHAVLEADNRLVLMDGQIEKEEILYVDFGKLSYMLGFIGLQQIGAKARHPPDMRNGTQSFYVYSDIVDYQKVGNTLEPLLRVVPITAKFGEIDNHVFAMPHYVPVLHRNFNTIHMSIKADNDRPLALNYGKLIAKLHFKRKI